MTFLNLFPCAYGRLGGDGAENHCGFGDHPGGCDGACCDGCRACDGGGRGGVDLLDHGEIPFCDHFLSLLFSIVVFRLVFDHAKDAGCRSDGVPRSGGGGSSCVYRDAVVDVGHWCGHGDLCAHLCAHLCAADCERCILGWEADLVVISRAWTLHHPPGSDDGDVDVGDCRLLDCMCCRAVGGSLNRWLIRILGGESASEVVASG